MQWLSCLIEEEQEMKKRGEKTYKEWLEEAQKWFKKFVYGLEKELGRNHRNMETSLYDAKKNLDELMNEIGVFKIIIRKKIESKIEKDWQHLMIFQLFDGAPATNNPLENYYSCSLKTHKKTTARSTWNRRTNEAFSSKKMGNVWNTTKDLSIDFCLHSFHGLEMKVSLFILYFVKKTSS